MAGELGLNHNRGKSEMICDDSNTKKAMLYAVPGLSAVDQNSASLLGSLITNVDCISIAIWDKSKLFQILGNRLQALHSHDAFCLLRNALAIPKVLYTHFAMFSLLFPRRV